MSEKYSLGIRKEDKDIFRAIERGDKTIETRAAKGRFKRIEVGDVLVFNCANEKTEKKVGSVNFYDSVEELAEDLPLQEILPSVSSVEELKERIYGFPHYREKIKNYGIVAFKLVDNED